MFAFPVPGVVPEKGCRVRSREAVGETGETGGGSLESRRPPLELQLRKIRMPQTPQTHAPGTQWGFCQKLAFSPYPVQPLRD